MNQKQMVYSLISTLLQYPEVEWKSQINEVWEEVGQIPDKEIREPLGKFLTYLEDTPYEELCENYVYTFDFYEKTTLYLTHKVFKDNRERGEILVQLRQEFYKAGLEFLSDELPDYLPLILEFAAIAPEEQSERILRLHKRSIDSLQLELQGINSPYRYLIAACMENMVLKDENENEKVS
ncbi:nitrate reductase molybdenum cofactor assembly chaperone [Mesobacillus maritimus]|uniref:nitrate reductase molybdenum cofactor assembly chaperone n=1 Tax=Mesobacillus maritimus TaxID=1643336 RepID=UPI00203B1EB5|nr:nitrate reductase molybdenum cofactor assembly chaperone [Mesobacillus maritimus]MCM3586197.1 nitrate reductase molybdenum cofactor assembly chaperone [Mesobacillus maritimus]MCM3667524.1 nitrate reductase molybdenum cofactor assembly chaperone [Mesobacillus maritimus]